MHIYCAWWYFCKYDIIFMLVLQNKLMSELSHQFYLNIVVDNSPNITKGCSLDVCIIKIKIDKPIFLNLEKRKMKG